MKTWKKVLLIVAACVTVLALIAAVGFAIWQNQQLNRAVTAMTDVNESLTQAESDRDAYKEQADSANAANEALQEQLKGLEERLKELEEQLKSSQAAQNELKDKNASLQQQLTLLVAKKQAAQQSVPADQNPAGKVCYLTFDDGPSQNTLSVLETLAKYNVKATFFVVGSGNTAYLSKIHEQGHALALHCNNHTYSSVYASEAAYLADLKAISEKVENATGVKSMVVRFPGGSSNTVSRNYTKGLMSSLTKLLPEMGYAYFDWNVASGDAAGNNVSADKIVNNVLNGAKGKDKVCVLMHDGAGKATTAAALPRIIEGLTLQGFSFDVLTPQVSGFKHSTNN